MLNIREAKFLRAVTRFDQAPHPARPAVVFAGRSNVGKSSLINALVRKKGLARTSSTPGRTQEIVFFEINGRFHFIDLPGYGYAKVPEKIRAGWGPMIETFLKSDQDFRLVVVILDVRRDPSEEDHRLIEWLESLQIPLVFAVTKIDKVGKNELRSRLAAIQASLGISDPGSLIPFSAITGFGRNDLLKAISGALSNERIPS